jgi:hypothetical protein
MSFERTEKKIESLNLPLFKGRGLRKKMRSSRWKSPLSLTVFLKILCKGLIYHARKRDEKKD